MSPKYPFLFLGGEAAAGWGVQEFVLSLAPVAAVWQSYLA